MARPKKSVDSIEPVVDKQSRVTVSDISQRWASIVSNYGDKVSMMGPTFFSTDPYVQNSRLKNLKTVPLFPHRDTLENALLSPGNNEQVLREMSWSLYSNSYPYYKMLRLYADILSYKHYAYPQYVDKKEFKTTRFKEEEKLVYRWIQKLDPERTFRRIVMETLIEGKRAYAYRHKIDYDKKNVEYVALQELPSNWWKPTYKSTDSYFGISFNFAYFWTPGTSVEQFPPIFKEYYSQVMGFTINDKKNKKIDFSKVPKNFEIEFSVKNKQWYVWAEMPATDVWCFSADESNAWQAPPFLGMFLSYQDLGSYQFLQTQLASIPLYGIISGEVPLHADTKQGASQHSDDLRLSPGMITMLTEQATNMTPSGVSAMFAPVENIKFHQFQEQVNSSKIYTDALQQVIATSGLTGLQSTSEKPTVAMVAASKIIEKRFSDVFYPQFMHFVNVVFEKKLNLRYSWKFEIFGDIFSEKDSLESLYKGFTSGQSFLLPKLLAHHNLNLSSAQQISYWVNESKIYEMMKSPPSAFQSSPDSKNGRPSKDEGDIENDSTAGNYDRGLNQTFSLNFEEELSDESLASIIDFIESNGGTIEM